ncbi:phage tail tape measure protein [Rahnella inusitata]|uniref:phage tail tape measure protein n=1 Tax=Rahnella inusitata TaxID=58169 RepID=UPI001BC83B45|nr:phage tail tape measure protein [Rahnella inusitata]QUT13491.1 phage tail tape measure protein [Rahnella inusitata]
MATLRELIIKISANSTSFQSEIARASRMGENYYRTMEQGSRRAESASRQSQRAIADLNGQLSGISDTAKDMAGIFAGAFATGHLINLADEWNQVNARLKQASQSTEDFSNNQKALMAISQVTGTAFGDNASLFARSAASMREFGYSSQDVLKITESVSTGLKLSGASAEESSSVITQFSQALAQGVLRGEEFNAVNEAGDRVIRALAAGMGVARKDLKAMADQGQLTIDKVVPALISQLGTLRGEFASLPASVSGSVTKVENAFQAWVGAQNQATGVTASLSGLLDGLANNMDQVASTLGVLVGIGAARFFGNMASGVGTATTQMIAAQRAEVALAAAQVRGTQISTARARATVYRAQQAKAAALSADQQAAAERRLTAAQAQLTRNMAAREAAQTRLNSISSIGARLGSGLLGAVGGIPGIVLGIGAAWLYTSQQNEQARREAQEYGKAIEDIRQKTKSMGLTDASDNIPKAQSAFAEQNRLIEEQSKKVKSLQGDINTLNEARNNPSYSGYVKDADLISSVTAVTAKLAVEQERLNQMQSKSDEIQSVLAGLEYRRIELIRQQAAEQNTAYQSLLMMNGQHTEFNRLLSLGNTLLQSRAGLVNSPMRVPQADVSTKDQQSLQQRQQQAELAGLTGLAKVRKQAQFDLEKMGKTGAENATYSIQYTKALEDEYNNTQRLSDAKKGASAATKEQNKAEREAAAQAEQYTRKMADLSVAIEVQRVRATEGEKASELYAASHQTGTKWTEAQIKAIRESSEELAKWNQKADETVRKQREQADALKDLTDAARKYRDETALTTETAGLSDRQRSRFDETQQVNRVFAKTDQGAAAISARNAALTELDNKYKATAAAEADWMSGASRGYSNWLEEISNVSGTVSDGVKATMDSAFSNVTSMLEGNKVSWKSWGVSVLQVIEKVALQMAAVSLMGGSSGSSAWGGLLGTIAGGAASYFGGGAAASSSNAFSSGSYSNLSFNAKGGVYDSPSLSSFSNGVYSSPTMFAFAKGAGVFGEAGPEAIMPLTRAADGSLGVRALGSGGSGSGGAPQVYITIDSSGNASTESSGGWEQFGTQIANYVNQLYQQNKAKDLRPGGDIWNAMKNSR